MITLKSLIVEARYENRIVHYPFLSDSLSAVARAIGTFDYLLFYQVEHTDAMTGEYLMTNIDVSMPELDAATRYQTVECYARNRRVTERKRSAVVVDSALNPFMFPILGLKDYRHMTVRTIVDVAAVRTRAV